MTPSTIDGLPARQFGPLTGTPQQTDIGQAASRVTILTFKDGGEGIPNLATAFATGGSLNWQQAVVKSLDDTPTWAYGDTFRNMNASDFYLFKVDIGKHHAPIVECAVRAYHAS